MIRHIVFFNARDPKDADKIFEGLSILKQIDPTIRFEVSRNLKRDQLDTSVDVVVYGEFPDEAALAAYKAHPIYQESIRRVRPIRDLRIAADVLAD